MSDYLPMLTALAVTAFILSLVGLYDIIITYWREQPNSSVSLKLAGVGAGFLFVMFVIYIRER